MPAEVKEPIEAGRLARLAAAPPVIQILAAALAEERPKEDSDG